MESEKNQKKIDGKANNRKLTLLQYVIYLGVTPCALAALALLVFIVVKQSRTEKPPRPANTDSIGRLDSRPL